jgi:predicted MFS family arabinose efflux permease
MDQSRSDTFLALGGLLAMAAAVGIGRFIYTPILPPMQVALGISGSGAGLIASANFVGYLAGALLAALVTLPGDRRAWLVGALLASAATTAAMGLTTDLAAFLLLRLIGGVASALVLILASSLVLERLARHGRRGLTALHFSGVGMGIVVSAGVVASLQAAGRDWTTLWFAGGALALAASCVAAALIPGTPAAATGPATAAPARADGRLRRMTLAYGLFGFGYVITATFIVAMVRGNPVVRPLEPIVWVVVGLSAAPSVLPWMWLARHAGTARAYGAACLAEAVGILASVLWQSEPGLILAAILLGGTFMGLTMLGLMRARELATGDPGRAIAMMTGAFGLGQIIGPVFAGVVRDMTGSFALPSCVAAGGLLVGALLARR